MRQLNERERRTVRIGAIGLVAYLVLFYGYGAWQALEATRREYQQLRSRAQTLEARRQAFENKQLLLADLKTEVGFDPAELDDEILVGEASAAIQEAAQQSGIQLGPIRESSGRSSGDQLASMHFQGEGSVESLVVLLHRLKGLGYPLILDSLQINKDERKPNQVQLTFSVLLLDFDHWTMKEGGGNA